METNMIRVLPAYVVIKLRKQFPNGRWFRNQSLISVLDWIEWYHFDI